MTAPAADRPGAGVPAAWSDGRRAAVLTAVFFGVAAIGIAHHELWRDEWQAWLLARDSVSFLDLLANLRHEAHPPSWNLLLFVLSRFTRDPIAMQGVHLLIATTSIYLLARFAPLPWLHKVLIAFGYFLIFEYAVIARQYALAVLALFAFCALVPVRRRHPVPVFLALLLLASTSVYGLILSAAAGVMLVVEAVAGSARISLWPRRRVVRIGLMVWIAGLAVALLAIRPEGGYGKAIALDLSLWSLAATASTVARAFLPLPDLADPHIWNTHFLPSDTREQVAFGAILGGTLGLGAVLLFLRKPAVLFMYVAGTGGLIVFRHMVYSGTMRHHGHLFLVFVACLWLAALPLREWRLPAWLERWHLRGARPAAAMVLVVLLAQVAAAALLYRADVQGSFSAAPEVAAYIREHGLEHLPIGASPAPAGSAVAGVLDRPIHYLALGAEGTFVRWHRYPRAIDRNPTMDLVRPFLENADSDVLLLLRSPLEDWDPDLVVTELGEFPAGLVWSEGYVLYRVRSQAGRQVR